MNKMSIDPQRIFTSFAKPEPSANTSGKPDTRSSSFTQHTTPAIMSTRSISEALQEVRSLAELTKTSVADLEALLSPSALAQITSTKRLMRETHQDLERLQSQTGEKETAESIRETAVEAWRVYQRLVKVEEKLRRAVKQVPASDTPYFPRSTSHSRHHPTKRDPFATSKERQDRASQELYQLWAWPGSHQGGPDDTYTPQSFGTKLYRAQAMQMTDDRNMASSSSQEGAESIASARMGAIRPERQSAAFEQSPETEAEAEAESADSLESANGLRLLYVKHGRAKFSSSRIPRREEVESRCAGEEMFMRNTLYDADRKREGSGSGSFVTYAVLAGMDDGRLCLPRLRFIKIHEVKRLKEYLVDERHLRCSGEVSRMEKVLQLIFALQEGWRMETIAVLFSRTPQQVDTACHDVFEGLLAMHSETMMERQRAGWVEVWKIWAKFQGGPETARWEQYYGWTRQDVLKVLETMNMYMARYRQQGRVALEGGYQRWWRPFAR